ncbi:MAG TPA: GTPase HflX [Solirubrobacteraceae bacterium]|nr:GTPase HflX [Solirubrobacteraceae bacterium]
MDRPSHGYVATHDGGAPREGRARQRALCIASQATPEDLGELGELLRTAGVAVVGELIQQREHPHPNSYLGSGKLEELKALAAELDANVIACDDELSPRQERTLESELGIAVVDRTAIILDIFARHAGSAEGKLQVELAQLEYNLARMRGLWTHLERLGGGVGTRGPGETQIETDRRLARNRIAALRRRLRGVHASRQVMRGERERSALPQIALAGYTNAGKSTLLNALTGSEVAVADRLFQTLDPTTRGLEINGRTYLLSDTVGFIRKLPHQLVDAFAATLEETRRAALILHVVDASASEEEIAAMTRAVEDVLEEIGAGERPRVLVLNKADLLDELGRTRAVNGHRDALLVSAASGDGLEALRARIEAMFVSSLEPVELLMPYAEGGRLAELHELAGELEREDTPDGVRVRALLSPASAARFARFAYRPAQR